MKYMVFIVTLLSIASLCLTPLSAQAAPPLQAEVEQPSPGRIYYKILVDQDGIYRVTYADLQAAGLPVSALDPRTFQIFNQGAELPIYVEGESDGIFSAGEYFIFYGQKINTRFTNSNVYWLTWGSATGQRMSTADGGLTGTASVPSYYATTARAETDKVYKSNLPSGATADHWYWDGVVSSGSPASKNFTINLYNLASGTPNIKVRGLLKGDPSYSQHHVQVRLNNNLLSDARFDVNADYSFEVAVPQSYLLEGTNTFNVKVMVDVGLAGDLVFVNWFEIDYYDQYKAESDQLFFDGDSPGTWEFQVSGFTTNAIEIYDITAPLNPVRILNPTIQLSGSSYQARFKQTLSSARRYLALTTDKMLGTINSTMSIALDVASDLRNPANGADWLAISYGAYASAVQPLADFRATQGYRTRVVDVQDIYDEFNGGVFDPNAIQSFLTYIYSNWKPPAPKFILLVGDGNYDYKNLTGTATPNYVPPYLADVDPFMGETVADNRYVAVAGNDILPDMHLGRLPARSAAETTTMVNKIINYETIKPTDGWNQHIGFIADNADLAGDFASLSDVVADHYLPASYTANKIYYGVNYPLDGGGAARSAIINAINSGRLIVSYVGHSAAKWWSAEKLFQVSDIASLTNSDRLPFMLPMTCNEGYFINPSSGSQSLGEEVVRAAGKGAIASWSPTGQGVATGHDFLERGLFTSIFYDKVTQIGPATDAARRYLYNEAGGSYRDLIDTYVLFGDPATNLQTLPGPTAVTLASFDAFYEGQETVRLEWETVSEVNLLGFNLYRSTSTDGARQQINVDIIASQYPGSPQGAVYNYHDEHIITGERVYYWLETLETDGAKTLNGPIIPQRQMLIHFPLLFRSYTSGNK